MRHGRLRILFELLGLDICERYDVTEGYDIEGEPIGKDKPEVVGRHACAKDGHGFVVLPCASHEPVMKGFRERERKNKGLARFLDSITCG